MPLSLLSHDIPFLNSVVNIIYHMENQELNRYVGDYDHFQEGLCGQEGTAGGCLPQTAAGDQ